MPELQSPAGPPAPHPTPPAHRRAPGGRPGWQKVVAQLLGIAAMFAVGFSMLWYGSSSIQPLPPAPVDTTMVVHPPVIVEAEPRLPPVAVVPPSRAPTPPGRHPVFDFDFGIDKPLLLRRRLPVSITMYCLKGTTRSGLPVRPGIVAADPRVLPLGTTVDLYVGLKYYGRVLVDDTGGVIKGAIIDIWTPSCTDARRFGRRRGAVVLVQPAKKRRR